MLRKRINFLCTTKQLSRKELVQGLITVPHLSNILLGRYQLAKDLAVQFSSRLGVSTEYLLDANTITEAQKSNLEILVKQTISNQRIESFESVIPETDNSLYVEFISNLCKACFYYMEEDMSNYHRIVDNYLSFYLPVFANDEELMENPLIQKAILYFQILSNEGQFHYTLTLEYLTRLLELVSNDISCFLPLQVLYIEILGLLEQYSEAKKKLDSLFRVANHMKKKEYFSKLYLADCRLSFQLRHYDEAWKLSIFAQTYIKFSDNKKKDYLSLIHYQYVILLQKKDYKKAIDLLNQLDSLYVKDENLQSIYFCGIFASQKRWAKLQKRLGLINEQLLTEDQQMQVNIFHALVLYKKNFLDDAKLLAEDSLFYFEKKRQRVFLMPLYLLMAKIEEKQKKYKQANKYNKKIIHLLQS